MNNYPPVSVYIVTYLTSEERCEVLRQTCRDALALRYSDYEVVVSDNMGPFSAKDALSSIDDPRLKVYANESNEGFTGNVNRCLKHCSHDVIKLMCDDDLIHPDFLTQTVPLVDDETLVVVGIEKYPIGQPPETIKQTFNGSAPCETRKSGYDLHVWNLPYKACSIPSATLFTRGLFQKLGGYDATSITSDWDFFIEACLHAKVVYVQTKLCFVGVWEGSLTEAMTSSPYFFPRESLYTKFRVMRCKGLDMGARSRIMLMLLKEFFWQGLRVVKHPVSKVYWVGFSDYAWRHVKLMFKAKRKFEGRPNDPVAHRI